MHLYSPTKRCEHAPTYFHVTPRLTKGLVRGQGDVMSIVDLRNVNGKIGTVIPGHFNMCLLECQTKT